MHAGFPFEHLSDYNGSPLLIRGTVSGFGHEDDEWGRGDGRDTITLGALEVFTVHTWVPLVVDTSDYNLGNILHLICTYTKQMQKLGLQEGDQIQFRATGKTEQCQGYSYHENPFWYTHPTVIRPCQISKTQYNYAPSLQILEDYDRFVEEYMEEKFRDYEELEYERKNRVKTAEEIRLEQRNQKIQQLRQYHKEGKIKLEDSQLKKGGFKGVSSTQIDEMLTGVV